MVRSNKNKSRVAVVTGAGHGIGAAIAERLCEEGVTVVVNYAHSQDEANALVAKIRKNGGTAVSMKADMSRRAEIRSMFAEVDRQFGRLDILVNNAGITKGATLAEITEELIDEVFTPNIKGALFAAQEAIKRLGEGGRIVNISSSTTLFPMPGGSLYTGSKAILKLFTEVWAKELGPRGITVNSVVPGPSTPGSIDYAPEEIRAQAAAASPFGRIGTAQEIAAVVAFLCSDDARWVSGQHLVANGAASM